MPVFTRTTKNLIIKIDEFFDNIDLVNCLRTSKPAYPQTDQQNM